MAQTREGAIKIFCNRIGISIDEYMRLSVESKWCFKCREWKQRSNFNVDNSRCDKLCCKCNDCNRVKVKVITKGRPSHMKGKKFTGKALENIREEIDNRLVIAEYLIEIFHNVSCNWRRVYYAAEILIDGVCDPMEDHLAYLPGLDLLHAANEQ